MAVAAGSLLSERVAATLYDEATLLAEEMGDYFDGAGQMERQGLAPKARAMFAAEALNATIRVIQVTTWLLTPRAGDRSGERDPVVEMRQLGESAPMNSQALSGMPTPARRLILAGIALHERVGRIASGVEAPSDAASPVRGLFQRRERGF